MVSDPYVPWKRIIQQGAPATPLELPASVILVEAREVVRDD